MNGLLIYGGSPGGGDSVLGEPAGLFQKPCPRLLLLSLLWDQPYHGPAGISALPEHAVSGVSPFLQPQLKPLGLHLLKH